MKYLSHFSLTFDEAKKNSFLYIKKAPCFLDKGLFRKGFVRDFVLLQLS